MVVTHGPTGKPFATKYAHSVFGQERDTIEEAWPGDVIGLVNAMDVTVGDALYLEPAVEFPRLPEFAPEHFVVARVKDTGRFKQFRRGIAQLDEEGVVQVLRDQDLGDQAPMLAAVGPMQFEVAAHRLEHEFGAPTELSPTTWRVARKTDEASTPELRSMQGVAVYAPRRGHPVRPVRVALLAGEGRAGPPRAHPGATGRRGHGRLAPLASRRRCRPRERCRRRGTPSRARRCTACRCRRWCARPPRW